MEKLKDMKEMFESTITRLKKAGVDTTCYKDVVIALETEIQHYRDLIEHLKECGEHRRESARKAGIKQGMHLGQCAMAAKILEYFMELCGSADDHRIHADIEDLSGICLSAWIELQGTGPVDG